jgi:hypothetical protein
MITMFAIRPVFSLECSKYQNSYEALKWEEIQ